MASITAPLIETQPVVTGTNYLLSISEGKGGSGITRIEIGPYHFPGVSGQIRYPESPTNEVCPSGWKQIRWNTDREGASWLLYEGGILKSEDGERAFQFTSSFPPSAGGRAKLIVWRGSRSESFEAPVPDYSQRPPKRNPRHDSTGLGKVYNQWGCLPQLVLSLGSIVLTVALFAR